MTDLRIHLFGRFEVLHNGEALPDFPTRRSKALFAILVLDAGQPLPRTRLVDVLWQEADESHAKKCLSTELWRIRSVLRAGRLRPEHFIIATRDEVTFDDRAPYWLDVKSFEEALETVEGTTPERLGPEQVHALRCAVDLYRGDLLEGIYDDWCSLHRESLSSRYQHALEMLMHWQLASCDWEAAIASGQELLARDPLLEHVHRTVMHCFAKLGIRSAAIRQYGNCVQRLREELGIEPMEETEALFRSICGWSRLEFPNPAQPPLTELVGPLDLALEHLQRARRWLARVDRSLHH